MSELRRICAAGEIVFLEGDLPDCAYLIEHGRIEVSTERNGVHSLLAHLGPGELFGEMALIDASPRTATTRATIDSVLIEVDRKQIEERLQSADPVVRTLLRAQLQRYRAILERIGDGGGAEPSVPERALAPSGDSGDRAGLSKIRLDSELRDAIERGAIDVLYQPIRALSSGRVRGYEALVRWLHPERGPVSPMEFVAVAEETSLIVPLGRLVMRRAAGFLATLSRDGLQELPVIAVNVSGRQLEESDVVADLAEAARGSGVPLGNLKVEITESLALDLPRTLALIERCHQAGIQVSLDDFGTGYSNLGHLHRLHFDSIKLDRGLVSPMMGSERALAIVRAVIAMARSLGSQIIAEGVETDAEYRLLESLGCDHVQGYLVGRPMTDIAAMELQRREQAT